MATFEEAKKKSLEFFNGDELAADTFVKKYALKKMVDKKWLYEEVSPPDMHARLAKEFYRMESKYSNAMSESEIFDLFKDFKYIVPQGSPMSVIGNPHQISSISNCVVLPKIWDSYGGICYADEQILQLSKRRCGVGLDISPIRPKGAGTKNSSLTTDGISSYMERYSNSIREVGQCIAAGEKVLTNNGLKKIEDIDPKTDKAWTRIGWVNIKKVLKNGKKKVFKTTTSMGYTIKTTENHIFMTHDNGLRERKLKEFEIGDDIVLIPGTKIEKDYVKLENFGYEKHTTGNKSNRLNEDITIPDILDEKLAYFLGYSYGDGYVEDIKSKGYKYGLSLACSHGHPSIEKKLSSYVADRFNYELKSNHGDGSVNKVAFHSVLLIKFLNDNGLLKQKAGKLEFPEKIENSPSSVQAAFISGYFDADGCAQKSKKVYKMASIDFDFIRKVQDVLMANGIVSRLHFEDRTKLGWKNLYTLAIVGKLAQERFIVFMRESEKVKKSKFVVKRDNVLTPYVSSDFGLTRQSFKYCPSDSQFLSSNTFNRLSNEDGVNIEHEVLIKDSIVSMVELDEKVDTYDLKLEKEHLFWCASFYVHNSGRRGAMMLTINVHHPEVLTFATIKKDLTKVTGANISIFLTDEFLKAVEKGEKYEQRWPVDAKKPKISIMVDAKEVWNKIIETAHLTAEPGLMFIDSIIKDHPASAYADEGFTPHSSNPCSEISMNADTCRLMAINMSSFVENPFTKEAKFDFDKWSEVVYKAQRLMDDMVDLEIEYMGKIIAKIESDPEPEHIKAHEIRTWNEFLDNAIKGRRTGLGVTAIGDAFAYLGVKYGSDESIALMDNIFKTKKLAEYRSSIDLAKERGSFPIYNYEKEKHNAFIKQLIKDGPELDSLLKKHGRRNVCISTIAPTGSVSILTQTTSGIEPVFALSYTRKKKITTNDDAKADYVDQLGDKFQVFTVYHHGVEKWMKISGETDVKKSPYHGSTSYDLNYQQRVKLQAAAQKHIDHAISSTVNLPNNATIEDVSKIYTEAWSSGLKGITVYRDGCRDGILVSEESMSEKKEDKVELLSGNAIRRPKKIPCDIFQITADGEKWTVLVGLVNGKPYEVFCGKPKKVELGKTEKGYIEKEGKGVYSLHIGEDTILKDIGDIFTDTQGAFSRMISTSLRHGVDIQFLVQQLEKSDGTIFSFSKAISRVLKKYIVEGAKESGVKCKDCGSESLVRQEGCVTCKDCGWSKC